MTGVSPYEALFGRMWEPSRGSLLKWKDSEGKSDVNVDDIDDKDLAKEYVRTLKNHVSRVHDVMRKANAEATLKRDKKLAPAVDAFNKQVEERLLSGVEIRRTDSSDPAKTKLVYLPGSYVLVKPRTKVAHKFSSRLLGPWLVTKHDLETETLTLPSLADGKTRKIASDAVVPFDDSNATLDDMKDMAVMDDEEYVIEEVIGHVRNARGRFKEKDRYAFKVKWLGYEETTMEPWGNLAGSGPFIEYCKSDPNLKKVFIDGDKSRSNRGRRRKQKDYNRESSDSDDSEYIP
ncbi:hypothetical protein ADUPG1_002949 [Aduncisulcus paluster]|uniref:Chromo domain-containing protein n=2 Tax=Aduncisulcus paluster TaxID=2918883 RepID=A0ABQ5KUB7_9EUKA|nr:hypothetical protein ADUPG1_002949 [Aduncisulcus paluster]